MKKSKSKLIIHRDRLRPQLGDFSKLKEGSLDVGVLVVGVGVVVVVDVKVGRSESTEVV